MSAAVEAAGVIALTRNVRLCNPGNVDRTTIKWQGMSALQDDPRFIRFVAPQWGFRCMARILLGHYHEGLQTLHSLIGDPHQGWAPANENDTNAYVIDLSTRMNVGIDETLALPQQLPPLLRFIAIHEGGCPWPDSVIQLGIDLERSA